MKKKTIYITIAMVTILVILLGCCYFFFKPKEETYHTITSSDQEFSILFPDHISYRLNSKQDENFVIDLYSTQDEMFFYASTIPKSREFNLLEVAQKDKENYQKDKENIREDSGVVETKINENKAYEYQFIYYDASYKKDFYTNVIWIETQDNLYILNFEVVTDHAQKYKEIFSNVKNSFIEL